MNESKTKRKKILFMIDSLEGGGAERVLTHLLRDLDRNLFEIELFLMIRAGVYLSSVPEDVPVHSIFRSTNGIPSKLGIYLYRFYRRGMLELFKLFPPLLAAMSGIKKQYDLGVSFCEGHNTPLLSLKSGRFAKTVAWIHVDLRTHKAMIRPKDLRKSAQGFDRLYFVSEGAKAGFLELFPEYRKKTNLEVVLNPIDRQMILSEAAKDAGIVKSKPVVLAIGRLMTQKRFDKLLNVHKRLIDKGIDHEVWILGEGPNRRKLENQAQILGVEQSCRFLGFRNPYPYLQAADIFTMTSDYEGLPVVVCEAMVLGKPIVATAVTGPNELLEGGKYGRLVANNEAAIEAGLQELLESPEIREKLSCHLIENRERFIFPVDVNDIEKRLISL
ncbi:MAG: glycosyltransferase [Dysgonamonadaceae bacterium]|jgi:glycosyltransferase involved in cell wall biosynthesis|nr:glycosyltransferase [Dysgonamonadaceae bacterium]